MVSLERSDKTLTNAEDDDSDEGTVGSGESLLMRPPPPNHLRKFQPIYTGYISLIEVIIWIVYTILLVVFSQIKDNGHCYPKHHGNQTYTPDSLVAYFCIGHAILWACITVMDRIIQWRHQIIRKRGYLMFYRKMRNIRRVPFVIVSTATAIILVYTSLVYRLKVGERTCIIGGRVKAIHILEIIIGMEMIISISCLLYYIGRTIQFNIAKMLPDVVLETNIGPSSLSVLPPGIGFREGEDMDELLEKQADMIRYLQQHNANLERRLLYLQQTQNHS